MSNAGEIERAQNSIGDAVNPNPRARRTPADVVGGARAAIDAQLAPKPVDIGSMPEVKLAKPAKA